MGFRQRIAVTDGQIEPFAGERNQPVGHFQLDAHLRMQAQKIADMRLQLLTGKGDRRRDAHPSAQRPAAVAHGVEALFNLGEGRAQLLYQLLSRLGQPHAARGAQYQRHARQRFQLFNLLAHRRLADFKPLRRAGKAALFRQHRQPVQMQPERVRFQFHYNCSK